VGTVGFDQRLPLHVVGAIGFNQRLRLRGGGHRLRLGDALENALVFELRVGARSAAGSMTALSLAPNMRGHRFQMHHYRGCAGDPLMSWRGEPLSLLIFLCGGKESKCRPAQGQR
jgi:hypothetical protein